MSFKIDGIDDLKAAIRNLPADLVGEATNIIQAETNAAEVAIRQAYPYKTGELVGKVSSSVSRSQYGATGVVKNASKLAYIFEGGTQARHTALGANRGAMPPGHVFVPIMQRRRRAMQEQFRDLLVRNGLAVRETA